MITCNSQLHILWSKSTNKNVCHGNNSRSGGWTVWSVWSNCSAECGPGMKQRTRSCTDPTPEFGGAFCDGANTESMVCTISEQGRLHIILSRLLIIAWNLIAFGLRTCVKNFPFEVLSYIWYQNNQTF